MLLFVLVCKIAIKVTNRYECPDMKKTNMLFKFTGYHENNKLNSRLLTEVLYDGKYLLIENNNPKY